MCSSDLGHIGLGAVKSILAKVYLTMAGYPLQDGSCWQKAYDKAKEDLSGGLYNTDRQIAYD